MTQASGTNKWMVVLALLVVFSAIAMFLGVFGISAHRLTWGPFGGTHHWLGVGPVFGLLGVGTLLQILLALWVGIDANRRGMNGWLWGLLVLFTFIVGLLVYLIVAQTANGRRAAAAPAAEAGENATCGQCGGRVESGFRACPFCGAALAGACPSCARPSESEWKVCPYCSTQLTA